MKAWAVEFLRCTGCGSRLALTEFRRQGETTAGVLRCESCSGWYPVIRGVPRMTPPPLREELTSAFVQEYRAELGPLGIAGSGEAAHDPLENLKQHTIANFGFEWLEYARFGWDDPTYNLSFERTMFERKSFLDPDGLTDRIVLDAGCGNGRYTYWAAQSARYVFGIDLGAGVESAAANTASLQNVQIVQADIFNVPFGAGTFDAIFSIGVLMHTGDARRATMALAKKVRPGGTLSVHLYGKGNHVYELIDRTLRRRTTKMSIPELQRFTKRAFGVRRTLDRLGLANFTNRFVRLGAHPHIIFDWYAAPIATHHTHSEVQEWFEVCGLSVIKTNRFESRRTPVRRLLSPIVGGQTAVTVMGAVPA